MPRKPTKNDRRSILRRARQQRYRARKNGVEIETVNERRQIEKQYSFTFFQIDYLHITYEGRETIIGRMTQEQFRQWFCGVVDTALPHVQDDDAQLILQRARLECTQYEEIDDCVRFDLINTLYELQAFRQSGVAFVHEAEMASRQRKEQQEMSA